MMVMLVVLLVMQQQSGAAVGLLWQDGPAVQHDWT